MAKIFELPSKDGNLTPKTLPKALRTQALTAFTSNFGLVWWIWFGRKYLNGQTLVEDPSQHLHCHFGGSCLACEKVQLPVFASKMKKTKRVKKRKKSLFLALLNVGASLHLCKQLNFLSFICSNKTVTEKGFEAWDLLLGRGDLI